MLVVGVVGIAQLHKNGGSANPGISHLWQKRLWQHCGPQSHLTVGLELKLQKLVSKLSSVADVVSNIKVICDTWHFSA